MATRMSMGKIDVEEDTVEADISGSELLGMAVAHKSGDDSRNDTLQPGPLDISSSPEQGPHQPKCITFAQNSQGRRFNPDWYNTHPWLEYSVGKRQAFCCPCRHFAGSSTSGVSGGAFLSEGEDGWGKGTGLNKKDNQLLKHEHSQGHEVSVVRYNSCRQTEKSGKTVMDFLDEGHRKAVKTNSDYIKIIADVLPLDGCSKYGTEGTPRK
ncbi:hypothetical protein SNE40_011524 [Patella caerulea]|uniref:TTF-type domain-containing protein n=1 Tax=Patella caerulea TaxID=87958 RepID=A0AAN8JNP5_PATCE